MTKLCKNCLGCMLLEDMQFKGKNECEYAIIVQVQHEQQEYKQKRIDDYEKIFLDNKNKL